MVGSCASIPLWIKVSIILETVGNKECTLNEFRVFSILTHFAMV